MKNVVFWDVRSVALVRTDVSKKYVALINKVKRFRELAKTLAVPSN
jgi:hypothetical protein